VITLIDALNFRCLRNVRQPLDPVHVLVGPNASGKTTFLDVVAFLGDVVSSGLERATRKRTRNPSDLAWSRSGNRFELAIEARLPAEIRSKLANHEQDTIRYEVAVCTDPELAFEAERVSLLRESSPPPHQLDLFPAPGEPRSSLLTKTPTPGIRTIINKVAGGNDNFYSETYKESGKGWQVAYKLGPRKSALANLPEDESAFPAATWLKAMLTSGVQSFVLNSLAIREASPPGQERAFRTDGSNLPWVIAGLEGVTGNGQAANADALRRWLDHVRIALPDIEGVRTVEREDDRHRYLVIRYAGGLEVPSWMASDGTLRLLALTLPAYLPDLSGIFLVEEPENGLHPQAVEVAVQSLSSAYGSQMLMASHSPVVLSAVEPGQVLCFGKTSEGETAIVRGTDHPMLRDWKGEVDFGTLFASGILS
jgi:predicted ATPase